MSFADRLTRCPRPFDPDRGREAAAVFDGVGTDLHALLTGAAGCSPYLAGVMTREAGWLRETLDETPEASLAAILATARRLDDHEMGTGLRIAKRRLALLVGLADLGGIWDLGAVTGALTELADLAVQLALRVGIAKEIARDRLPGRGPGDLDTAAGMVVLAMGKMGAAELNYSSDIDLICLFDESRFDPDDYMTARAGFVRATQTMTRLLSDRTGEGYVFRTDLRLRPDPSVTPVCIGMEAAERYYESLGRTWERSAHIKARPCAGDLAAGAAYLERLRPFVWRRQLDFAAIEEAHAMRLRIREHKGLGGPQPLEGYDVKLGRGGIREIEFFTQTRQMIAGGRDPSLRVRGTCEGLVRLAAADWIGDATARTLAADYADSREVEHRVQMVNDTQTHQLPTDAPGFARLAAMMDRTPDELRCELSARFDRVAELTDAFFDPPPARGETLELTAEQDAIVTRWRTYPALRSHRAQQIFDRLSPALLSRLAQSASPDRALIHLDGFLAGLPAGVQIFSLFESNPTLIDLIVDIADTAPELARYLSRNSGVLDAVIGGSFFTPWPGMADLCADLDRYLGDGTDYETRLDLARLWAKEWKFRIGVHHLRGLIDANAAGAQYAEVADCVVSALWPIVAAQFESKHGKMPGRGAMVLGMGSLGARRLNAYSDLDLIVIYDAAGQESSDGKRPLASRLYFARLTQALVTALSAPMSNGRLYEVDMRLRPSGRQGPVATALSAFETYQREEAWTWEHLALTRARPVTGTGDLCRDVAAVRTAMLAAPRDANTLWQDVADMRARLEAARASGGPLDAKNGPGRLQDIELAGAALALLVGADARDLADQVAAGRAAGLLDAAAAEDLTAAHETFWRAHVAVRLLGAGTLDPADLGAGGRRLLLRGTEVADLATLADELAQTARRAADLIDGLLATGRSAT